MRLLVRDSTMKRSGTLFPQTFWPDTSNTPTTFPNLASPQTSSCSSGHLPPCNDRCHMCRVQCRDHLSLRASLHMCHHRPPLPLPSHLAVSVTLSALPDPIAPQTHLADAVIRIHVCDVQITPMLGPILLYICQACCLVGHCLEAILGLQGQRRGGIDFLVFNIQFSFGAFSQTPSPQVPAVKLWETCSEPCLHYMHHWAMQWVLCQTYVDKLDSMPPASPCGAHICDVGGQWHACRFVWLHVSDMGSTAVSQLACPSVPCNPLQRPPHTAVSWG